MNIIIVGPKHSDKETLIRKLTNETVKVEPSLEGIRAIRLDLPVSYVLYDFDDWHKHCYSAMLKKLESYHECQFILTVVSEHTLPSTVVSRCRVEYVAIPPTDYIDVTSFIVAVQSSAAKAFLIAEQYENYELFFSSLADYCITNNLKEFAAIVTKNHAMLNMKNVNQKHILYLCILDLLEAVHDY